METIVRSVSAKMKLKSAFTIATKVKDAKTINLIKFSTFWNWSGQKNKYIVRTDGINFFIQLVELNEKGITFNRQNIPNLFGEVDFSSILFITKEGEQVVTNNFGLEEVRGTVYKTYKIVPLTPKKVRTRTPEQIAISTEALKQWRELKKEVALIDDALMNNTDTQTVEKAD